MAQEYRDDEEYDDYEEDVARRRPSGPRFGPFVTIAVAILLLFGAASRIGKPVESGNWLSLDLLASKSLQNERLRLQEQRNTTLVTLGAVPVEPERVRSPSTPSLRIENQVLAPPRGELDYDEYQRMRSPAPAPLSLPVPTAGNTSLDNSRFDPAPEAVPDRRQDQGAQTGSYIVRAGDNWVKIGKAVGRRWQDLLKANPQAADGLRVGMRLAIP